ncbi:hypothetical protein HU200_052999 [Digitaria exilis]|uniref:Uncharacterized protein n=1 Tax=Digitaria exilis TaxID=1010633 RepID=A0A835E5F0_9POAL|nr:hypothetical protein HU200_052999 [Digitaria exilis]
MTWGHGLAAAEVAGCHRSRGRERVRVRGERRRKRSEHPKVVGGGGQRGHRGFTGRQSWIAAGSGGRQVPSKGPSRQTLPRRSSRLKTLERGSKLEGDVHPRAGVSATFKAQQPSSRRTFTLERAFPSRSRLSKLELAGQARACHTGNSARCSATITTDHNDPPLQSKRRRDSLHHATTHTAEKTPVKSTWRMILCQPLLDFARLGCATTLEGDHGGSIRTPCHEKNIMSTTAMPSAGVGRRDFRLHLHLAASAPRTHPTNSGTWEFISFSHLACNPLLRATRNWCSAPLLDVRSRGRNQDKNSRLSTRHRGNECVLLVVVELPQLYLHPVVFPFSWVAQRAVLFSPSSLLALSCLRRKAKQLHPTFSSTPPCRPSPPPPRSACLYGPDDRAPIRVSPHRPRARPRLRRRPARLAGVDSPIIRLVAIEYGVGGDAAPFIFLGGFRNTRSVYELEEEDPNRSPPSPATAHTMAATSSPSVLLTSPHPVVAEHIAASIRASPPPDPTSCPLASVPAPLQSSLRTPADSLHWDADSLARRRNWGIAGRRGREAAMYEGGARAVESGKGRWVTGGRDLFMGQEVTHFGSPV